MLRALLGLSVLLICHPLGAANFWLSSVGTVSPGSSPPTSQVQTITKSPSDTQGTFYIWARPDAGENLSVWGLNVISTNTNVASISLAPSAVEVYNPLLGTSSGNPKHRWSTVGEPSGTHRVSGVDIPNIQLDGIRGTTLHYYGIIEEIIGVGIGPANTNDPYFDSVHNAWLLASVDYTLTGNLGQTAIYLQIADNGMAHNSQSSSETTAVFGLTSDPGLNAGTQRKTNSATADLVIQVSDSLPGDFNGNGVIDGRDFLAWQRNPTSGNLVDWRNNYPQTALVASTAIPEPHSAYLLVLGVLVLNFPKRCR